MFKGFENLYLDKYSKSDMLVEINWCILFGFMGLLAGIDHICLVNLYSHHKNRFILIRFLIGGCFMKGVLRVLFFTAPLLCIELSIKTIPSNRVILVLGLVSTIVPHLT